MLEAIQGSHRIYIVDIGKILLNGHINKLKNTLPLPSSHMISIKISGYILVKGSPTHFKNDNHKKSGQIPVKISTIQI